MEVDEAQTQASKFSRVANGRIDSSKAGAAGGGGGTSIFGVGDAGGGDGGRLRGWQHSSRIIRVSRASGGKDRHSKVWTAKGPRDRRVRLSVATAIQFYDLQDRLGVDQPSKAVEWLIKAAADAIAELPSLEGVFPETPRQISDEKRPGSGGGGGVSAQQGFDSSAELEIDGEPGFAQTQQQHGTSRSSACSSNSETSKGSGGLSLSRNEIRVKARERARERTAKDKERETESISMAVQQQQQQQLNQSSSSFTQLLTAGIRNMENAGVSSNSPMDYFNASGLMSASSSARGAVQNHSSSGFSGQIIQLGNSAMHQAMMAAVSSPFSVGGDQHNHTELQHFPFIPDHLVVPSGASGGDHYNLNFSISQSSSSGLAAGFNNRGTLQSNSSQSLLPHQLQRFSSSPLDGTTVPFFLGAPVENQHHQHSGASLFPPELQLYYGNNGGRQSDQKGKGKN